MFVFNKRTRPTVRMTSRIVSGLTVVTLLVNTVILPLFNFITFAEASYAQNNSTGSWNVDFNANQQGIAPDGAPLRQNVTVDTAAGVAKITTGQTAGYFHTTAILPNSFTAWDKITIDATYSNSNDIRVSLTDCTVPTPVAISGFQNMTPGPGGVINVASLSSSYTCVKVRVDLNDSGGPRPVVNDVKMTWIPLPVFLLSHTAQSTRSVGDTLVYVINYSVSYVTDPGVVVWAELPSVANGTVTNYTASYGVLPNPTFVSATNSGTYTATGTTVNGITVPANSVYWNLGSVPAGRTGTLSYQLQTQNGWENGIKYSSQAHIDSALGTLVHSDSNTALAGNQPFVTTLVGTPTPSIDKQVFGAVRIGTENFVVSSGSYTPLITYQVKVTNVRGTNGIETIWNPVITDNLSDIYTKMSNVCGIAAPASRVTVNDGGAKVGNTLVWDTPTGDLTNMGPGAEKTVSYTIDYTGCPDNAARTYTNLVSFDGDNINPITDQEVVKMGVTAAGGGTFSKGAPTDQYHNDSYDYTLNVSNSGTVALGDIVMADKMDTTLDLVSVNVPSNTGAIVYYNSTGSGNAVTAPPAYTITPGVGITGTGWTTVQPPVGSTVWTAVYIPCVQSNFFNATPTNTLCYQKPTAVTATVNVRLKPPVAACTAYSVPNTGVFSASRAAPTIANDSLTTITPITATDTRSTNISPRLGALGVRSEIIGPNVINVTEDTVFTIHLENSGVDTAQNVQVVVPLPKLNINGVNNVPIDFVNATGATIIPGGLPNQVTLSVGNLPAGMSRDILLTVNAPKGIQNLDTFTLNATVTGTDDNNCRPINAALSKSVTVVSEPNLSVFKSRKEAVIPSGGDIHYTMQWSHAGTAPTTQSYVVDFIPTNAVFKNAYTTGTDATGTTFTCTGCKVYFSDSLPSLPPGASPFNTISHADIVSSFSLGTQVSPGVWTSPFGTGTHWVAWLLDDPTKTPNMVTTGRTGTVGLTVTNDDNGVATGSAGSPAGTVITNESAVFSNELLQAIGNQVSTTILPSPGLSMTKSADRSVIGAGETFNWNINYYNDGSGNDDAVTLADTITLNGSTITKVFHQWNAQAVAAGAPTGLIDITANPNLTLVDNFDGTTTITWNATTYKGSALAPLEGGLFRIEVAAANDLTTGMVIPNTVVGTYQSGANPPESISSSAIVTVENPDLWIRKIVDRTDPLPGQTVNYTLTISNESSHPAPGVVVTDTLPIGVCYVSGSAAILSPSGYSIPAPVITGDCLTTPQILTWNTTLISPSGTGIIPGDSPDIFITYRATVSGTVASGTTLTNGASISTTLVEDTVYPNTSSQSVTTPNPDPYLSKTAATTVNPGSSLQYAITYGNNSNQSATNVYIIDTLPDYDNDGTVDVTFSNSSGTNGESFYYHTGPITGTLPTFDPTSPLTNGWTATPTAPVAYIAIRKPTLAGLAGPFTVKVNVVMNDPDTSLPVLTGLTFTNHAEIFLPSGVTDAVATNNSGAAITKTPGFDLAITKVGSSEGSFPGLIPGASNTYTITYTNSGTVPVCDVHITDTLDPMMDFASTAHNFSTLVLKDSLGNSVNPFDLTNNPILTPIAVTSGISGNTLTIDLGNSSRPASQICLPPGSTGTFQVYATVKGAALDSTSVINQVSINTTGSGIETETSNNTAASAVRVYRADLVTSKTGTTQTGDTTNTNPGDTITYTIEYDNIGNTDASDAVISDIIPSEVCYIAGSLTAPSGSTLQFSNDHGSTWVYTPVVGASGDCNVTNVRVVFGGPIPAPAHYDSEGSLTDFINAGETNLQEKTLSGGGEVLMLKGAIPFTKHVLPLPAGITYDSTFYTVGNKPMVNDFNGDGKLDYVVLWNNVTNPDGVGMVYLGNDTTGLNFTVSTFSKPIGSTFYQGIQHEAADFDKDGDLDFLVISYTDSKIYLYTNNGQAIFTNTNSWNIPGGPMSLGIGDINNDGFMDAVTASGDASMRVLINNGTGNFTVSVITGSFGQTASNVNTTLSDYNHDGYLDFSTPITSSSVKIYLGNASGIFTSINLSGLPISSSGVPKSYDMNNDGVQDIVYINANSSGIYGNYIIYGDPAGVFTNREFAPLAFYYLTLYGNDIDDLNNDTFPELFFKGGVIEIYDGKQNYPYFTDGRYQVSGTNITTPPGIASVRVIDVNNDGYKDLISLPDVFINHFGEYVTSGSYTTTITATDPVTAWNKLLVNQTVPAGTSLTYTILPSSCTGTPLIATQSAPNGYIDISSIPATTTSMCLRVNFATTNVTKTPTLDAWRATHTSSITPKFTYQAKVKTAPQLGLIPNSVSITTSTPEIGTNNNDAIKEHNLIQADIAVTKTVDKTAALGTDNLVYTINYNNQGPQPATTFRVTDTLSTLVGTPTSIIASPTSLGQTMTCGTSAGVITCDDDGNAATVSTRTLSVNETGTITITVPIISGSVTAGDIISNTATVTTGTYQITVDNDTATVNTVIGTYANVWTEKTGPTRANVDHDVVYTITYGNNGNSIAHDVAIEDTFDPNVTVVSANSTDPTMGSCTNTLATITCGGAGYTLPVGASYTLTVTLHVNNDLNLLVTNEIINNSVAITTTSTEASLADNSSVYDIPVYPFGLSTISGSVFIDTNGNISKEFTELPLAGVTVTLTGTDIYGALVTVSTTTDAAGNYTFSGLKPGTYSASEIQPAGYDSTGASAGTSLPTGNGTVSGPNMISNITVGEAQNSTNNNFGEVAGSIGNQVFYDTNSNGIFETGTDLPLAGVRILLVRDSNGNGIQDIGEPVQVAYTDATGNYHFDNLALTQYIVKVSDTAGILAAYTAIGGPSTGGADDESKDSAGYRITLFPATPVQTLADFGYNAITIPAGTPGSIGTKIFADFDANGQLDGADVGISGVSVDLYRDNDASGTYTFGDTFLGRVFTDVNGDYLFGALPLDRRYVVRVSDTLGNLSGYVNTLGTPHVDNNGQNPLAYPVYLQTGVMESVISADFSYQPPYPDLKITKTHTGLNVQGGTATYNLVVQNKATASGNATAPIRVTDTLVADLSYSTATGTDWDCSATVAPLVDCTYIGTYPVTPGITLPTLTITAIISTTAIPPLTNTATVSTPLELPHVLADNTVTDPVTYVSASADGVIGTTVWVDEDGDGEHDVAEPGIENVTINLYSDLDGNGLPDDRDGDLLFDPVLDRIATTMTDSNGEYLFTGLDRDDLVNGYYDYLVSVDTSTIPAGYTHTLGIPVTDNFSQIETNYTIRLSNTNPANVTADFGYRPASPDLTITKTHTQPIIHQGDIVEFTLTVNNMAGFGDVPNTNEIIVTDVMPAGMILIPSATVAATNALGAGWNCTTSTSTQLRCISTTGLVAGSIAQNIIAVIEVNPVSVPTSIANTASVTTVREESAHTLNNTGSDTFDVVLSNTGTIGSTVWDDQNGNGFRDSSEPGIGGVRVYLYQDVNEDGLLDSGDILIDTQITSTTGTIGEYSFVNLERDLGLGYYPYIVHVEDTDVTAIDPQYILTIGTAGSDNFSQPQDYLVTLNSTNLSNLTADFGFKLPPNLTLTKTISGTSTVHIGESMTFLLEVANIGGGSTDGTDIVVTDTLPSNLTFSVTGSSPECNAVGQLVTCTLTGIPAVLTPLIGNHSFTIVSTANTVGPVENTATVSGGGIATPVDSAPSIGVVNPTTWDITKSGTPLTGTPGTSATFTITITNSGAGDTQGTYTVTDTLPAGLVFTTTGSDTRCSAVAQVITCTDTTVLAPTASTSFDIVVAIANAGSYDNTATVSGGAATTATSNTVTVVRTALASGGGGGTGSVLGGGCIVGQTWNGVKCVIPSTISPTSTPVTPKSTTSTSSLRTSRLGLLWQTGSDTFGSCEYPILTTPIKFGALNNSDDVKFLEQFLNTYEGEKLTINGIYEKTDFDAVVRWQEKYFNAVLKPWNLTKGTGYVYKTSLAQIARQYQTFCTSPASASPIAVTHDIPMKPIAVTGTRIRIPSIKLDTMVYTTGTLQQAKGNVWHSPDTEMPDQGGNTVLVGHRYINLVRDAQGNVVRIAPKPGIFFELPNVPMGADIYVTYNGKEYHYQVTRSFEVMPSEIWVEDATISPMLTLYTCTPLYTHNKRHVLRAELVK